MSGPLGLGRLSIIDLAGGQQPAHIGQCRNDVRDLQREELRSALEQDGHRFSRTQSDTEVIVHGYKQ
jgi:asparagine synthetase B (glutamine-hydrolysing)